ncbi:MAG: hypothetical protein K2J11_06170 [Oscillospiraceae bacterium]|nr:hypothetical protein [Oscillospiraceae bacterium]
MEQLLSIKHIPIKVEVNVTRGEFKRVENSGSNTPSIKVSSKQGGGLRLQAEPYRMEIPESRNFDTYVPSSNYDSGITLTYEAVAKLADGGNYASGIKHSGDAGEFSAKRASRSIEAVLQSLPKSRSSAVSYSDGVLSVNYQMTGSESVPDLASSHAEFEFIPGSIEFIISQMPELDIEYLGDPIYFPRSADPNYEPIVDVLV